MPLDLATDFASMTPRVWLNCAHQGPLPNVARVAAETAVAWKCRPWELTSDRFAGVPARLKAALGRLIGVAADEVILGNGASYGLDLVAGAFPWRNGDEVLTMRGDFPSDILPWLGQARRGVVVRQLRPRGRVLEPDEVEAAIGPGTRLLCLTWVHSLSGWAIDADAIGRICRAHGVTFVLNASQALGVRPMAVRDMPVDALVSVGWKWLVGPYATGFCWLAPDLLRSLQPTQTYWLSMLTADDLGREEIDLTLRDDPGARRWDVFGTANFFNFAPFAASIEYLLDIGVERIGSHDALLVDRLLAGLDRRRWRLTSPERGPQRSTLVFVEPRERARAAAIQAALAEAGVHVAHRAGALRIAPHLYNSAADVDRVLDALDRVGD